MSILTAEAVLFDFDGTLIDSAVFYDDIWSKWAIAQGLDPAPILAVHHGRRFADTLMTAGYGHVDLVRGGAELLAMSLASTEGLRLVPGARAVLEALPAERWAIVTSAGRKLVEKWLAHFNLPTPGAVVSSESVTAGKPSPEGYLMGASLLGFAPARCVVFEDAPAGLAAGSAAGCTVVALATTHRGRLPAGYPVIDDFSAVSVTFAGSGVSIRL